MITAGSPLRLPKTLKTASVHQSAIDQIQDERGATVLRIQDRAVATEAVRRWNAHEEVLAKLGAMVGLVKGTSAEQEAPYVEAVLLLQKERRSTITQRLEVHP